jgi:hypothetical protein
MEFRFRYLGATRQEVEVASVEKLRELVQDGTVGEMTLLFDALTREWAPARAHAIYRFLRDEARPRGEPSKPEPAARPDSFGLGLSLSMTEPETDSDSDADEAVRQILKARERDGDGPARPEAIMQWSQTAAASMVTKEPVQPSEPEPARAPLVFQAALPVATATSRPSSPPGEPLLVSDRRPIVFTRPAPTGWVARVHDWLHDLGTFVIDNAGTGSLPRLLVLAGLIGLLLVLVATVGGSAPAAGATPASAAPVSPEVTRLVTTLGPAQSSGFQNMVAGIDSLRGAYDILAVPPIWLDGKYLSDAPAYPEVKDFWLRYQAFLEDVRAHDTTMYRAGLVEALQAQGVDGAALTLRSSEAMRDFEQSQPRREDVYRHMEELSSAALALHALLVDRAGDIKYAPAIQHGVSREPIVEAVAEDTVLHDHMWTLLDRIFASLEWIGGDVGASRDDLADKMLRGIQATAR